MPYRIEYSDRVNEDIPEIPKHEFAIIKRAIDTRLAVAPLSVGKSLSYDLSGSRSLRVGKWRIGYAVDRDTVSVFAIDRRRDAYDGWL